MKHFQSILYLTEPSVEQGSALARAVSLAENNQAALTVMDVVAELPAGIGLPPGGPISNELQARVVAEHRQALESLLAPYRDRLPIRIEVRVGRTYLEAIRAVIRDGHDLLLKPAEDPDFLKRLFGSDDMHLLRKCPCPVWLTKAGERSNYRRILAAIDFEPDAPESLTDGLNGAILELAASLALSDFAELHLLHVWDAPAEMLLRSWSDNPADAASRYVESERLRHQSGIDAIRRHLRERLGPESYGYLDPKYHSLQGSARRIIPQTARRLAADLVVMGTVGRSGIPGLFVGNTAEAVLEQLQCAVLALKPRGFVSPVQ